MITSNSDQLLDSVSKGHLLSDHHFFHCKLRIGKDDPVLTKSERNIKELNHTRFDGRVCDELNSNVTLTDASLADLVNSYNSTITNILDDLAPITTRALKTSHRQLWYSDKIRHELKLRHWKETKWLHDPSSYNYNAFFNQCRYVSNLIKTAQRDFSRKEIIDHRTDYKYIFNLANGLLFRNQLSQYPEANSDVELANGFNEFFKTKIDKIMDSLHSTDDQIACDRSLLESSPQTDCKFTEFREIGEEELRTIIKSAPTKSCENDPLPTSLLKEHLDAILTPLTKIVNTPLRNGEFSDNLKEALLRPLIKKHGMDLIFGSFRPASNLTFLSKLTECVAAVN